MRSGPSPTQRDYNVQKIYKSKAKQYIFAFEGAVTEPQYFDGIRKYAEQIGIAVIGCRCRKRVGHFVHMDGLQSRCIAVITIEIKLQHQRIKNRIVAISVVG